MSSLSLTKRYDERVYQENPKWTVQVGATALTSANFIALSNSEGQLTFQIQAPSQSVYLDRVVQWTQTVSCTMTVDCTVPGALAVFPPVPFPVVVPGRDFALCSSPLHALVTTMQANICNQQVSSNLYQNRELMDLLADTPMDREWRTHPCALDVFANNNDAFGTSMNPLAGFDSASVNSMIGNGSWPIIFTNAAGVPRTPYTDAAGNAVTFTPGGIPQLASTAAGNAARVSIYFQFTSTEPIQLSPFVWREVMERKTGLSQIQNILLVMSTQGAAQARLIRTTSQGGRRISSPALWPAGTTGSPFLNASVQGQFLSPPLGEPQLPLATTNTVDLQQVQAYIYQATNQPRVQQVGAGPIQTQTLSLPSIPDWMVIAVQPSPQYMSSNAAITMATWYVPIFSVSASWSNVSGLLSAQTQAQLFGICKANGLKQSWDQWRGYAQQAQAGREGLVQLTGGPLVLRPGVDLTLPQGQAAGMTNGNWTFSINIFVDTSAIPLAVLQDPNFTLQTTVLTVNSGFFTSTGGESRLTVGPLSGPLGASQMNVNALAGIPSAGALFTPAGNEISEMAGERLVGSGRSGMGHMRQRHVSMKSRIMRR